MISKRIIRRFVSYYRPHIKLFIADLACAFSMASIDLVFPVMSRYLLQQVIPNENLKLMIGIIIALIGMYLVRMLLNYFVN
jgi:ATP-binding cassette subfamily B protein